MQIIRDDKAGTLTLVPMTPDEIEKVGQMAKALKFGEKIVYGGIRTNHEDKLECIYFFAASKNRWKTTKHPSGGSSTEMVHIGGIKLELIGTSEEDQHGVERISDFCYYGSGGLILLNTIKVNNKTGLVLTGSLCKICQHPMTKLVECEWGICDKDASKCKHNYARGAIHGGGLEIGVGHCCKKCGRVKPMTGQEKKMSVADHHLAVEKELGVTILYKYMPGVTPSDLALMQDNN
ncbi:hypothetical protein D4S03_09650 [bacterium]|nr:MAG: hypothetical protein D4S03_09650 [bacterium]